MWKLTVRLKYGWLSGITLWEGDHLFGHDGVIVLYNHSKGIILYDHLLWTITTNKYR